MKKVFITSCEYNPCGEIHCHWFFSKHGGYSIWSADMKLFGLKPFPIVGMLIPFGFTGNSLTGTWLKSTWVDRPFFSKKQASPIHNNVVTYSGAVICGNCAI